ncbi:MAG: hypothetical protein WB711_09950 [Terriglobales bacterium]
MKTNSYIRIFVMTFLFFSFSAAAQDIRALNVNKPGAGSPVCSWASACLLRHSKIASAGNVSA